MSGLRFVVVVSHRVMFSDLSLTDARRLASLVGGFVGVSW